MTDIKGAVVLVTGGGRGLGKALVSEALSRGASKVYATARDPRAGWLGQVSDPRTVTGDTRVVGLPLEVSDPGSVAALAEATRDVTVLANNAGITNRQQFVTGDVASMREEFEVNFWGPLLVTRAVLPSIVANGGGHVLNVASVLSWISLAGSYSASKAALWSMTNSLRVELLDQGVGVTGLHVGYMDTDMTAAVTDPKIAPEGVAAQAFDGVEADAFEVLADDVSRSVRGGLSAPVEALYPQLTRV